MHYQRQRNGSDMLKPARVVSRSHPIGTVRHVKGNKYKEIKTEGGWKSHHRYMIEQSIGRKLQRHESVHHINGDKADNRLENLELWSSNHPAGQRVEDKVRWARKILAEYGEMFPA